MTGSMSSLTSFQSDKPTDVSNNLEKKWLIPKVSERVKGKLLGLYKGFKTRRILNSQYF